MSTLTEMRTRWDWRAHIDRCLASSTCFWFLLLAFLAAHIVFRLLTSSTIGENEVQEAVAAQQWAWGYHPRNPPLHAWLLMASYAVFGVGPAAHVALKYALLGAVYGFAYLAARRLLSGKALAALSALSIGLLAPFAWTVHTGFTHTLLLAAAMFAVLWTLARAIETRRAIDFAWLGVALACGFLAKYSFILFFGPLLIGVVAQPALVKSLASWRPALTLVVAGALFAPHGFWMASAQFDFLYFLQNTQEASRDSSYLVAIAVGFGDLLAKAFSYLAPFIIIMPVLFWRSFRAPAQPPTAWARATAIACCLWAALLLVDVVLLRAQHFELRYLTSFVLLTPLVFFQRLELRAPSAGALRMLALTIVTLGLIVFAGIAGQTYFNHERCKRCWEEMPFASVANAVRADGFVQGTIISAEVHVGGNMRLAFPQARIVVPTYYVSPPHPRAGGQCLLIWNARLDGDAPPQALQDYLDNLRLSPAGGPSFVTAPLNRSRTRLDRFAFWIVPNADGACQTVPAPAVSPPS